MPGAAFVELGFMGDVAGSSDEGNRGSLQCLVCDSRLEFRVDRASGQALLVQDCPRASCRELADRLKSESHRQP